MSAGSHAILRSSARAASLPAARADLTDGPPLELDAATAINGNFLPRVVAQPNGPLWLVLASPDYARVAVQRVRRD